MGKLRSVGSTPASLSLLVGSSFEHSQLTGPLKLVAQFYLKVSDDL